MGSILDTYMDWPTGIDLAKVLDPGFELGHLRALKLPRPLANPRVGAYLAHQVARKPGDLTRHAQRIALHQTQGEADQLYAALVDLFIALGHKGFDLKRRLLAQATPGLPAEKAGLLTTHLQTGLPRHHGLGDVPGSVLGQAIRGSLEFTRRVATTREGRPALQEARELMQDGLVEQAQEVLESALAQTPSDRALIKELLAIYRATRHPQADALAARLQAGTQA